MINSVYRVPGAPVTVALNADKLARRIAAFCANNNITTDAELETYINGLSTLAQVRAVVREVLVALTDFQPPPGSPG